MCIGLDRTCTQTHPFNLWCKFILCIWRIKTFPQTWITRLIKCGVILCLCCTLEHLKKRAKVVSIIFTHLWNKDDLNSKVPSWSRWKVVWYKEREREREKGDIRLIFHFSCRASNLLCYQKLGPILYTVYRVLKRVFVKFESRWVALMRDCLRQEWFVFRSKVIHSNKIKISILFVSSMRKLLLDVWKNVKLRRLLLPNSWNRFRSCASCLFPVDFLA